MFTFTGAMVKPLFWVRVRVSVRVRVRLGLRVRVLYGHFGPRTLRPQDSSAPIFGAELSRTLQCQSVPDTSAPVTSAKMSEDTTAPVPKCLKTLREGAAGQQQANRTQTCPCGPIVFRTVSSCFATLRQLRSIRRSTSQAVLLSLVLSLVLLCLDYGNVTLAGLPSNQLDRLQSVMNATAQLIARGSTSTSPHYSVTFTGCGCQSVVGVQTASANNNDVEGWHARLNSRANHGRLNMYQLLYRVYEEAILVNTGVHLLSDAGTFRLQRNKYNVPTAACPRCGMIVRCGPPLCQPPPHCLLTCREAHVNSYL